MLLSSPTPGVGVGVVESLVTVQPRVISMFRVASNPNIIVTSSQPVQIVIERTDGLQTMARVNYNTSQPKLPVEIGKLSFQPALFQVHFTQVQSSILFNPGDESLSIDIPILSVDSTPVAFIVQIGSTPQ